MTVQFAQLSPSEGAAVDQIIERYQALTGVDRPSLDIRMDLCATHWHTPMDLRGLSEADDFTLLHDVSGIYRHLDRRTGRLRDHFLPRSARPAFDPTRLVEVED